MSFLVLSLIVLNTITTGKTYTKSEVTTNIGGEGNVYTRIESEVNGQRQVLEASEPGSYKLEMGTPTVKEEKNTLETESEENKEPEKEIAWQSKNTFHALVNQIEQIIKKWWENLSRLFH